MTRSQRARTSLQTENGEMVMMMKQNTDAALEHLEGWDEHCEVSEEARSAAKSLISRLTTEQLEDIRKDRFPSSRWPGNYSGPPFNGYRGMRRAVLSVLEDA